MIAIEKIPANMNALVLHGVGDLRLEKIKVPELKKGSVLLHVKYCGICSSDIDRVYKTGTYHFPTIPGHEFCGEIVGVNEEDKDLLGKKASVFPLLPCNSCDACNIQEYAQCANYNYFGSRCDGGFTEYIVVPIWNLILFENMDYDVAALCEPAAVALHALRRVKIEDNKKIFIMGSGTIGILIALFAKNQGYDVYVGARRKETFDYLDSINLKHIDTNNLLEEANSVTNGKGFDYVFECVGSNESISNSILSCNNFAKIVLVGNPKDDLNLDKNVYWKILRKQITVTGTWNSNYNNSVNDWQDALKFMKDNYSIFKKLITNVYMLEEYNEGFELLKDRSRFKVKVMLKNR